MEYIWETLEDYSYDLTLRYDSKIGGVVGASKALYIKPFHKNITSKLRHSKAYQLTII